MSRLLSIVTISVVTRKPVFGVFDQNKNIQGVEKVRNSCLDIKTLAENRSTSPTVETTDVRPDKEADVDTRNQVEKTIDKIQGSLQDQATMEKCQKDEIAQQLQILKDALCSELEQERQIRFSMQQKLKEAHDALHNFSCTILSARQYTDCTIKDTASTVPR